MKRKNWTNTDAQDTGRIKIRRESFTDFSEVSSGTMSRSFSFSLLHSLGRLLLIAVCPPKLGFTHESRGWDKEDAGWAVRR
jgi:DNA primase catalytic subunit